MAVERTRPNDLVQRVVARRASRANDSVRADGWRRETFRLPRAEARVKARELFDRYPKAKVALGHMGEADDIAFAMLFLASREAKYITGQTIVVDGGAGLPETGWAMDRARAAR